MEKIGEPVAASLVVHNVEDGITFAEKIGDKPLIPGNASFKSWLIDCITLSPQRSSTFSATISLPSSQ